MEWLNEKTQSKGSFDNIFVFKGSFKDIKKPYMPFRRVYFREYDMVLSFGSPFEVQKSIIDFLDFIGLDAGDDGYMYLVDIIKTSVAEEIVPRRLNRIYAECGERNGTSAICVDIAIIEALKKARKNGRLFKMNDIFSVALIKSHGISNAEFITYVCNRFILEKRFNKTICIK